VHHRKPILEVVSQTGEINKIMSFKKIEKEHFVDKYLVLKF